MDILYGIPEHFVIVTTDLYTWQKKINDAHMMCLWNAMNTRPYGCCHIDLQDMLAMRSTFVVNTLQKGLYPNTHK